MNILRRRKKWQRVIDKAAANIAGSRSAKAGAGTIAGLSALAAASAAVSSRRKTQS